MQVEEPQLWWPNEYGEQPLYEVRVELCRQKEGSAARTVLSAKSKRTGVREVIFEKNEGAAEHARAYTLKINGRKIYMKGWNWVPIDVLYGVKGEEKLRYLIRLAKEVHVNMLRVWGGGLIEREEFYDLCDESGIFVWQEFIQSSSGIENKPSEEPEFLEMMAREAEAVVREKRHPPSLAVGVRFEDRGEPDEKNYLIFSDNYFYLMPGEEKRILVSGTGQREAVISCEAFHVREEILHVGFEDHRDTVV